MSLDRLASQRRDSLDEVVSFAAGCLAWASRLVMPIRAASFVSAALCALATIPLAAAKETSAQATAEKLTQPLTRESIRELVSRLDDAAVRKLLIDQLDRTAKPAAPKEPDDVAGMAQSMNAQMARLRERSAAVVAVASDVPAVLNRVAVRMTEPRELSHLWKVVAGFVGMLAVGAIVEFALARQIRGAIRRFEERPAKALGAAAVHVALRAGIGFSLIAAFALAALTPFLLLWQGHEQSRFVILVALAAVVGVRVCALLARLLLQPRSATQRLVPVGDRAAHALYWGFVRLAALFAVIRVSITFLTQFDAAEDAIVLFAVVSGALFVGLSLDTIWRVRADVSALIRGPGEAGALRRVLAELWPVIAAAYFVVLYFALIYQRLLGSAEPNLAPILSLVLVLVLPLVDMLLCRILAAAAAQPESAHAADVALPVAQSLEPVLRRAIHVCVLVVGFIILAGLWGFDVFAIAERSVGTRIASALLGIAITMLLAWMLGEIALTAIDRRMAAEAVSAEGSKPVSRLRTLLPLLRVTLQATIVVMAVLSILAALGVNIIPLLAGASVIGLAIGFGSQSLVRDIVSGAFFLMDDAFRLGEYIEVGDAKGVVEKIGVRSVVLRHQRGALNMLPYGEIKRLRNTSRDWMIMKLDFRLAYDTDLKQVKQIVKKIGQEIAADPELGHDVLEPLKSQGVIAAEEDALVVGVKFKANPAGDGAYVVRREAYARIVNAFSEAGIKFAVRRVTVNVPAGTLLENAAGAAAAGADLERRVRGA